MHIVKATTAEVTSQQINNKQQSQIFNLKTKHLKVGVKIVGLTTQTLENKVKYMNVFCKYHSIILA